MTLYRKGSKGPEVVRIQTRLKELEYYKGSIDGMFGKETEHAVKTFQKAKGLSADGIVETQTWKRLFLRLTNDIVEVEGRWHTWRAYLVADDPEELKNVKEVEYVLHPSFKRSIVTVKDSENSFELIRTGWGTFNLKATVYYVDDTPPLSLEHWLEFDHPDSDYIPVKAGKKSFFERIFSRE